ncbi:MAG: GNAT family N-acetyltransferase [Pyramidobacter sp.]|nr:GNAT family N-acetyltransferase [Pyramidobacter sp.]
MIRRAASHDLDAVEQVYMQRLIWERKNERYSGWIAGVYPSRTVLRRAIARGELYALWDGTEIVGAMSLTRGQPEAYEQLRWPVRSFPSQVIGVDLLCVSPLRGREGLGTQMLHYAIGLAQRTRARAVRLDCLERNVPMIALLEKTGFVLAAKKAAPCPAGSDEETRWYEYDTVPPRDAKRMPR